MRRQGAGSIVSVSSVSGVIANEHQADYNGSKHGLIGLARCIAQNFIVVGLQMAYVGIGALRMTLLIISGNIDLSIGSLFALCAVVAAIVATTINPQLAILIGILLGGVIGLTNGALVWRIRIPPIITLGSLTILRGLVLLITGGYTVRGVPKDFGLIGQERPFEVPTPVYALFILVIIVSLVLHTTTIGRHIYAICGNREVSEAAGLSVRRLVLGVFLANGLIIGLAGTLAARWFVTAAPSFGIGFELEVITAVILGGVAFTGGAGNVLGDLLAVALLAVLNSGMVSLGIDLLLYRSRQKRSTDFCRDTGSALARTAGTLPHPARHARTAPRLNPCGIIAEAVIYSRRMQAAFAHHDFRTGDLLSP